MGVGTHVVGQVLDTRQESEVPAMAQENSMFQEDIRDRRVFFQKWVRGQMLSVKSWTQDRNVRSRPWPRKI